MGRKVLIFGGTTEGRELARRLSEEGIDHVVSVATEYGKQIEADCGEENLIVGRKSEKEIEDLLSEKEFCLVVDVTHPFAIVVTRTIRQACKNLGVEYLRLARKTDFYGGINPEDGDIIRVSSPKEAGEALEKISGNILLFTGSRDLKTITDEISDRKRIFVRVLPNTESIKKCEDAGISGRQIIAMQGPFSRDMNTATIKEIKAEAILTKESGREGGFLEKLYAAKDAGIKAVVIQNPETDKLRKDRACELGVISDVEDAVEAIKDIMKADHPGAAKKIILAGVGPGGAEYQTKELTRAIQEADIIFGAASVLERIEDIKCPTENVYDSKVILEYLDDHANIRRPLIAFSGDISLCSGAKKASASFEEAGYQVRKISGISSVAIFSKMTGVSLEESRVVSAHGRNCNVSGFVRENENLFVLPSDVEGARRIYDKLHGMGDVTVGVELGSISEKIIKIKSRSDFDGLFGRIIMLIQNKEARRRRVIPSLSDEDIIRGEAPMTKEEVRALSIRKLGLGPESVLYDVGAGSGSVSLEAALLSPDIEVCSIERNEEAVELLSKNRDKFHLQNMYVIKGEAPEAMAGLPVPSHMFIGGSGGKLKEIISCALEANRDIKIVINCITLETLTEALNIIKDMKRGEPDIVQVNISRYKRRRRYHMADAMNPVFIISI